MNTPTASEVNAPLVKAVSRSRGKRVWIDLDNSPHVPFFAPIIKELERRGLSVTLTARDAYQVRELADLFNMKYKCVGKHYGKHKVLKVLGTCLRILQLVPTALKEKPDLGLNHGSRGQLLACSFLGIPSISIFDYEHTNQVADLPGGHFKPTWTMAPEVVQNGDAAFRAERNILQYPGIKEDVYVPSFQPDPSVLGRLGLKDDQVVILLRPPATEAHYHTHLSDQLFLATMKFLTEARDIKIIVLPRNQRQRATVEKDWPALFSSGKAIIPARAEDGLNLIWYSDLVISGGGTMNREAAALGVPVYSIFGGKIGAVDRYLTDTGRLILLDKPEEVSTRVALKRRVRDNSAERGNRASLDTIVDHILHVVEVSAKKKS